MNPKYPVYIISKGRADTRLTSRTLEYMNVPYFIVVEPQEYVQYASVINSKKILVTPFKNLGQGSIPARNFCWEHAISLDAKRHWILDDNIKWFWRLNNHMKIPVNSGTIFAAAEDFVDRYENIGLAGFQYDYFAPRKQRMNPFILNTRIYSCILIDNSLDIRWRGRYNEDTDLSIRVLKKGLCTILFNAFLCGKTPTLLMKGGNATELYKGDGRLKMAQSLVDQHPEIVTITEKWNRYQHKVDYTSFKKNELKLKKSVKIQDGVNEYGMELIQFTENISIFNGK